VSDAEVSVYDEVGGMPFFQGISARFYEGIRTDAVLLPLYPDRDDLDGAAQRALSGASSDEIRSSMEVYDPPDSPGYNPWTLNTYEHIKPALTFTATSPGLRKLGLPILDRKMNTVWAPRGS
jgi:hypothetical protein